MTPEFGIPTLLPCCTQLLRIEQEGAFAGLLGSPTGRDASLDQEADEQEADAVLEAKGAAPPAEGIQGPGMASPAAPVKIRGELEEASRGLSPACVAPLCLLVLLWQPCWTAAKAVNTGNRF